MHLILVRRWTTEESSIGELYVDGTFECYTLEDPPRLVKIAGKTAIPAGLYPVTINFSPRFKKLMPIIYEVPDYSGVRIHVGNFAAETEGCILVGQTRGNDWIGRSRAAFEELFHKMYVAMINKEQMDIKILEGETI